MNFPILSFLLWFPIVAGIILLCISRLHINYVKFLAMVFSLVSLFSGYLLVVNFDASSHEMQFSELIYWITQFNINYHLGIDGIALPFILLVCAINFIILLATSNSIQNNLSQYYAALFILQGLLIGVFSANDSILFYIFWEATLVPIFLIIGIWGSSNRIYAAQKFFLMTFFGSVLLLLTLIYLGLHSKSFTIMDAYDLKIALLPQLLIFFGLLLGFAIKIPMWPVHTWLPHAHTEAPTGGSVVLAAVLLKMGAYGFLRFTLPIVPDACRYLAWPMVIASLIAIIYIAVVALVQQDLKKLIAYSSISHMGFVTLGIFSIFLPNITITTDNLALTLEGAVVIMLSHAVIASGLFIGVGFIYDRLCTRKINELQGIANTMPAFAALFMLFAMANLGLPGTAGFVGEFMVIIGTMSINGVVAAIAAITIILSAAYTLWMYRRVFFGEPGNNATLALTDLRGGELLVMCMLAALILLIGLYPVLITDMLHASVSNILNLATLTKLG